MKRISSSALAVAVCLWLASMPPAFAVNPGQVTSPGTTSDPFNPALLPGQGYNSGFGNPSDPFFTPNLFNPIPSYPSVGTPSTTPNLVPNPNPVTYPDGRTRVAPVQPQYLPPGQTTSNQKKWRLGVYSKDLDTGVRIHEIVAGGAAARAGLEVNDQIVAVNGYQVGYVNGQLFDCGSEFDRNADQNGWVTLLVQNNRDRQLVNVPVQLDSRLSTLRGSIALQNRQNLPASAIVNVDLRQVVGNNSQPVTFASTQINRVTSYPIPFSIDFDPAQISPNARYAIYANVVDNGREIYRTPQLVPALERGQIQTVALQLEQIQSGINPSYPGGTANYDNGSMVAQIVRYYQQYLGRDPSDRELTAWLDAVRSGQPISQVQLSLLAHDQFFNQCSANKVVYVERMHELLIGRKPTREELNYWLARYDAQGGIRRELAREFQGALGIY